VGSNQCPGLFFEREFKTMSNRISRRTFLAATSALAASSLVLPNRSFAASEKRRLIVGKRSIEVNGQAASVFGITGTDGTPGMTLGPDQRFDIALDNQAEVPTSIHWHGQIPPPEQDGVSDTGYVPPLGLGQVRSFDFSARSGTHWMHSHHELQEQSLMAAPLIVHTKEDVAADVQEVILILHDFSFRSPEEILQGLTGGVPIDHGGMAMGSGSAPIASMPGMPGMAMDASTMAMGGADLNDVEYDAYLANDRTLDDPLVVRTERDGRVRLRIINAAASSAFWLDLGATQGSIVAVDGNAVVPLLGSRFPLAQAQRIDILMTVPAGSVVPVFAQREGDLKRTGIILAAPSTQVEKYASLANTAAGALTMEMEQQFVAASPLAAKPTDVRHMIMLNGSMSPYAWTIDDRPWAQRRKLEVSQGQRVELEFMNHSMMSHPMHLHGHHFQVVEINGQKLSGAMRDTVMVPPMGRVVVAFDADNPGRWLYHCHNLYHMATGMMSELVYI